MEQRCSGIVASSKVLKLARNSFFFATGKLKYHPYLWKSTEFKMDILDKSLKKNLDFRV